MRVGAFGGYGDNSGSALIRGAMYFNRGEWAEAWTGSGAQGADGRRETWEGEGMGESAVDERGWAPSAWKAAERS